ncbi:MAG: hypothetical protein HY654_12685 [Acidobacteria bacterium]|nr:hypothetical protein [Acidobacteriota bacterium]
MKHLAVLIVMVTCVLTASTPASAQPNPGRFEIGGQMVGTTLRQFDDRDLGLGGRFAWRPVDLLGIEAELNVYPSDFPDRFPFSRSRTEALFGMTVGPTLGRVRPFARARPGFVVFGEAPRPFPCIAIFPPPLPCRLAAGERVFAFDIGGGIEFTAARNVFVRFDAGDRVLRYPGPSFDADRRVRSDAFFTHDFRFAAGAGLRF